MFTTFFFSVEALSKKQVNSKILGFKFLAGNLTNTEELQLPNGTSASLIFKNSMPALDPPYETIMRKLHPGEVPSAVPKTGTCAFLELDGKKRYVFLRFAYDEHLYIYIFSFSDNDQVARGQAKAVERNN